MTQVATSSKNLPEVIFSSHRTCHLSSLWASAAVPGQPLVWELRCSGRWWRWSGKEAVTPCTSAHSPAPPRPARPGLWDKDDVNGRVQLRSSHTSTCNAGSPCSDHHVTPQKPGACPSQPGAPKSAEGACLLSPEHGALSQGDGESPHLVFRSPAFSWLHSALLDGLRQIPPHVSSGDTSQSPPQGCWECSGGRVSRWLQEASDHRSEGRDGSLLQELIVRGGKEKGDGPKRQGVGKRKPAPCPTRAPCHEDSLRNPHRPPSLSPPSFPTSSHPAHGLPHLHSWRVGQRHWGWWGKVPQKQARGRSC